MRACDLRVMSPTAFTSAPLLHWCVCWCADSLLLLLGERRHQFAAEGRDVRDDPALDRVESTQEASEYVSNVLRDWSQETPLSRLVWSLVCYARPARRRSRRMRR